MRKVAIAAVLAFAVGAGGGTSAQNAATAGADAGEPAGPTGLIDLEKTTFACPKAALNAAARDVTKYPSQGTYQFSYFNIVSGSHHAAYEVHFTSNVAAEPVLKLCVEIYCQQGFDPATSQTNVTLMGTSVAAHATGAGHPANACSPPRRPTPRQTRR